MRMTQSSLEYTSTDDPRAELWEPEPHTVPAWEDEAAAPEVTGTGFFAPPPPGADGRPFLMPSDPGALASAARNTPEDTR